MSDSRKVLFWSTRSDDERLTHESQEDAVVAYFDDLGDAEAAISRLAPLTVYGWARRIVGDATLESVADNLTENLHDALNQDEDLAGEDDNVLSEVGEEQFKTGVLELLQKLRAGDHIKPWYCDVVQALTLSPEEMQAIVKERFA